MCCAKNINFWFSRERKKEKLRSKRTEKSLQLAFCRHEKAYLTLKTSLRFKKLIIIITKMHKVMLKANINDLLHQNMQNV